jgi:hypothetical protein
MSSRRKFDPMNYAICDCGTFRDTKCIKCAKLICSKCRGFNITEVGISSDGEEVRKIVVIAFCKECNAEMVLTSG